MYTEVGLISGQNVLIKAICCGTPRRIFVFLLFSFLGFGSDYSVTNAHFRIPNQDHVQEQTVPEYSDPELNIPTARIPTTLLPKRHCFKRVNFSAQSDMVAIPILPRR